jgi:hypothetical protein
LTFEIGQRRTWKNARKSSSCKQKILDTVNKYRLVKFAPEMDYIIVPTVGNLLNVKSYLRPQEAVEESDVGIPCVHKLPHWNTLSFVPGLDNEPLKLHPSVQ